MTTAANTRYEPPIIRTSERSDYKRCEWAWWMQWRLGYRPRRVKTALWFGTGWHKVMDARYPLGKRRGSIKAMREAWDDYCGDTTKQIYASGQNFDESELVDAQELGHLLIDAYVAEYGKDEEWEVLAVERSFQIDVPNANGTALLAVYAGTMDKVMRNRVDKSLWIWDHKTAAAFPDFRWLTLADQPGSYLWVGTEALRFLQLLKEQESIDGIIFDYARKGKPDTRQMDADGMRLNKDGSVSKKQPSPLFHREPIDANEALRYRQYLNVVHDAEHMAATRERGFDRLSKTPTKDCARQCAMFDVCEMHERGDDYEDLLELDYVQLDPYRDHRAAMEEQGAMVL